MRAELNGALFAMLGQPGAIGTIDYQGKDWIQLKCWAGDRPKGDATNVDRVGLDGWPTPYQWGERVQIDLAIIPRQNLIANEGGWTNIFECHEMGVHGVGSIALASVWSASAKKPVTRLTMKGEILWQGEMVENHHYPFRFDFIAGGDGYFKAWLHNRQIADWRGFVGHKGSHKLYPQVRVYRAARKETATMLVRMSETRG